MKCPVCGCEYFYVKDPDNPYKYYQFSCRDGKVHFSADVKEDEVAAINAKTQAHCIQCVWQGEFEKLIDSARK